jgi:hypothetical protein
MGAGDRDQRDDRVADEGFSYNGFYGEATIRAAQRFAPRVNRHHSLHAAVRAGRSPGIRRIQTDSRHYPGTVKAAVHVGGPTRFH